MISVIIPVYNKVTCIKKTIRSVLNQSYNSIEIICVDDGSTDGSIEAIRSFEDNRIKLFSKENGGVSSARNYGIEHSEGEWLFFLDADDIIMPNTLELLMNLHKSTGQVICIGNVVLKGKESRLFCRKGEKTIIGNVFHQAAKNNCFPRTGNIMIHRDVVGCKRFNNEFRKFEDMDFFNRVLDNKNCAITLVPVFVYELDNTSLSKSKNYKTDYRLYIKLNELSFWSKVFHGQFLWDYDLFDFIKQSPNKINIVILLIVSFFPFILRMVHYKLRKPIVI